VSIGFTNLAIVAAAAFVAPLALGLVPTLRRSGGSRWTSPYA
jgi:hypothetical protein